MEKSLDLSTVFTNTEKKLLCLEVNPPYGVDCSSIFKRLDKDLGDLDFFNVTDSALARMKMSGFMFAAELKKRYSIEPLVNLSCRDRNLIAIQGDLLGSWMQGIKSVIALTGDAVSIGDDPDRKGVFEVNSVGLLNVINKLNSGFSVVDKKLRGAPNITAGVVVNPNAKNYKAEIKKLQRKKDAGAVYALSQPVFDIESSVNFFKEASLVGLPIFIGLLPIKNAKGAMAINKIPGITLSQSLLENAESNPEADLQDLSMDLCLEIARANSEYVCGYHVISGAYPSLGLELLKSVGSLQ